LSRCEQSILMMPSHLQGRYDERAVQRNIKADQEAFRSAVEDITGTSPERIAPMYSNVWRGYAEQRVTFAQAALEAGLSNDGLLAVLTPSIDPNLLYLVQAPGRSLSRDVWEDVFDDVMLLKGRPIQPKDRPVLPLPNVQPVATTMPVEAGPKITLKAPAQVGEQQQAKVVLKTAKPSIIKGYIKLDGIFMRASIEPATEHELDFTFTSGPEGFPKSVEITTDGGPVVIPVESKP